MKIHQIIREGGWTSTVIQDTRITPQLVRQVLPVVEQFVAAFNVWLKEQGVPPMKMGAPIGSTAYYQKDSPDTEYGDIDLQTIAPDHPEKTESQVAGIYNKLMDQFIEQKRPPQIHYENKSSAGHPIFKVGKSYVQVDFVWATEQYADWSKHRMTPAHKVKGAVHGSMFSSWGAVMNISLQSSGAQMKIKDNQSQPFARNRNYDTVETITTDMTTFGLDIAKWMHSRMSTQKTFRPSRKLAANPGLDTNNITSEQLADVFKGMAETFEINDMYGKFNLEGFTGSDDLISSFLSHYQDKMVAAANSSKFDKAEGEAAVAHANATKKKLLGGIEFVKDLMRD